MSKIKTLFESLREADDKPRHEWVWDDSHTIKHLRVLEGPHKGDYDDWDDFYASIKIDDLSEDNSELVVTRDLIKKYGDVVAIPGCYIMLDTTPEEVFSLCFKDGWPNLFDGSWEDLLGIPGVDGKEPSDPEVKEKVIDYIKSNMEGSAIAWHQEEHDDDDFGFLTVDEALDRINSAKLLDINFKDRQYTRPDRKWVTEDPYYDDWYQDTKL